MQSCDARPRVVWSNVDGRTPIKREVLQPITMRQGGVGESAHAQFGSKRKFRQFWEFGNTGKLNLGWHL
jgi:hypothetical protein